LVAITNPFGQSFYFDYDAAGEPTLRDAPVGRSSGSPGLGWLHAKSDNSVIASYDYERDGRGSPTRITDKDDHYRGFTYDGLNRLASETWRDENDQVLDRKLYYYDPADNRIALDQDGEPVIYYTYDARDALVAEYTAAGTPTYTTYNEAGSLLTEAQGANVTSYVWTPEELLARVDLPSGLSNYFEYDGDGRRWSKRDSDGLKRYLWDATPSGQPGLAVVLEKDDAGETTGAFTHDQGVTIMPGVGTILAVREGEADYLFHTDAQGTTREVTDASQIVVASFDLDAWGVERSRSGSFSTPYLFTGKERDPNPLLDYFIARQYQPRWGAFVSRDPLWPRQPALLYVRANPLVGWDATGREVFVGLEFPPPDPREPRIYFGFDCRPEGLIEPHPGAWVLPTCDPAHSGHKYIWPDEERRDDGLQEALDYCHRTYAKVLKDLEPQLGSWYRQCEDRILNNPWWMIGNIMMTGFSIAATIVGFVCPPCAVAGATISVSCGLGGVGLAVGEQRFCRRISRCRCHRHCVWDETVRAWDHWYSGCRSAALAHFATDECSRHIELYLAETYKADFHYWLGKADECKDVCRPGGPGWSPLDD